MITAVKGTLEAIGPDWAVVSLGGVSLKVSVPSSALEDLGSPGDRVSLFTHLQVRQDGVALFGFPTAEARDLFELLQGVSGVGPRQALSLLSAMAPETLVSAVSSGDIDMFERAPGVGKKTASRIVLELKGKLEGEWGLVTETSQQGEVIKALIALGYTSAEARSGARSASEDGDLPLEERLRMALQQLGEG